MDSLPDDIKNALTGKNAMYWYGSIILAFICLALLLLILYKKSEGYTNTGYGQSPKWMELSELSNNTRQGENTRQAEQAIVLSCMDFRLVDDTVIKLNRMGYINNYNKFVLAGSSLGYNGIANIKDWDAIFDKHVDLSIKLHNIKDIIIIDHLDCGAYRLAYTEDEINQVGEYNLHRQNLKTAKNTLNRKYPQLKVKLFILDPRLNNVDEIF